MRGALCETTDDLRVSGVRGGTGLRIVRGRRTGKWVASIRLTPPRTLAPTVGDAGWCDAVPAVAVAGRLGERSLQIVTGEVGVANDRCALAVGGLRR